MERTLKERLIGAAVLVAVAIILIPEMLSGPSTSTGNPSDIHSGDAHTAGKANNSSAVLSDGNTATPVTLPRALPNTDAASSQTSDGVGNQVGNLGETKTFTIDLRKSDPQLQEPGSNQTGSAIEQNKHVDQFPAAVAAETKTEGQKVEGQGAQSHQDASAAKQEPSKPKPSESASTATVEKPLPDKPIEKPVGASTTLQGWAVQLGSFGTRVPADQMVIELKKAGYEAFVMPFESKGKPMFRVRIGPFRDRSSAEAMQEKVKHAYPSAAVTPHP